jgi:S-formylglutathione hydrolase FrmB
LGIVKISILIALGFFSTLSWAAGTVQVGTFPSESLGVSKKYRVYLPQGYPENSCRYPVIYQLHGWGASQETWSGPNLRIQEVADAMKLKAIIVMPDGDRSMYLDSATPVDYEACLAEQNPKRNQTESRADFCVREPRYASYIINDLIPFIDSTYRTVDKKSARGISGESMGGFGAMQLAMRSQQFGSVVSHSGGLSMLYKGPKPFQPGKAEVWTGVVHLPGREEVEAALGDSIENWRAHDPYTLAGKGIAEPLAIYFDVGAEDDVWSYEMSMHFAERLTELNISHTFVEVPGGHHDDVYFASRAPTGLQFHVERFKSAGVYPVSCAE